MPGRLQGSMPQAPDRATPNPWSPHSSSKTPFFRMVGPPGLLAIRCVARPSGRPYQAATFSRIAARYSSRTANQRIVRTTNTLVSEREGERSQRVLVVGRHVRIATAISAESYTEPENGA